MTINPDMRAGTGSQRWRSLYLIAGISAISFVLLLITALVVDFIAPQPVHGGAARLGFIAANKVPYVLEQVPLDLAERAGCAGVCRAVRYARAPEQEARTELASVIGGLSWALILAIAVTSRGSLSLV